MGRLIFYCVVFNFFSKNKCELDIIGDGSNFEKLKMLSSIVYRFLKVKVILPFNTVKYVVF